jgi:hypothetical protein
MRSLSAAYLAHNALVRSVFEFLRCPLACARATEQARRTMHRDRRGGHDERALDRAALRYG